MLKLTWSSKRKSVDVEYKYKNGQLKINGKKYDITPYIKNLGKDEVINSLNKEEDKLLYKYDGKIGEEFIYNDDSEEDLFDFIDGQLAAYHDKLIPSEFEDNIVAVAGICNPLLFNLIAGNDKIYNINNSIITIDNSCRVQIEKANKEIIHLPLAGVATFNWDLMSSI